MIDSPCLIQAYVRPWYAVESAKESDVSDTESDANDDEGDSVEEASVEEQERCSDEEDNLPAEEEEVVSEKEESESESDDADEEEDDDKLFEATSWRHALDNSLQKATRDMVNYTRCLLLRFCFHPRSAAGVPE